MKVYAVELLIDIESTPRDVTYEVSGVFADKDDEKDYDDELEFGGFSLSSPPEYVVSTYEVK